MKLWRDVCIFRKFWELSSLLGGRCFDALLGLLSFVAVAACSGCSYTAAFGVFVVVVSGAV